MTTRQILEEAENEDMDFCLGCGDEYRINDMHPLAEGDWICKPCFRNDLEGVPL